MHRTLRNHLIAAQAAAILASVLTIVVAIGALAHATNKTDRPGELADDLIVAHRLATETEHLVTASRRYILKRDPLDRARVKELALEIGKTHQELITRRRLVQAESEVAAVESALDDYVTTTIQAARDELGERPAGSEVEELREQLIDLESRLTTKRLSLGDAIDGFAEHQRALVDGSRDKSDRFARRAEWTLGVIAALSILLTVVLGVDAIRELGRSPRAPTGADGQARRELLAASHELRRPLQEIVAAASSLEKRKPRDPDELQELEAISTAAKDVDQHLERLFDVTRVHLGAVPLRIESVTTEGLVELAIEPFLPQATKRAIRLRSEARASDSLHADRERICHVLTTLIEAALGPARSGGEIIVSAARSDDAVRFAVVDAGPSALPAPLSQLFDRYAEPGGTNKNKNGMGLYMCKRIVEAHGGHMGVERLPGRTTYWFTLPTSPRVLR